MPPKTYSLPPLPYGYDALEPHISAQIMTLHHSKHHQTYITNLNNAFNSLAIAQESSDIQAQLRLQPVIRFNAGGHVNHALFWTNLAPAGSPETEYAKVAPETLAAVEKRWGTFDAFKSEFERAALGIRGSGWSWLIKVDNGGDPTLAIVTTQDQEPVLGVGETPLLGVDMWEHAYYLQYLNGKAAYVENIWKVINWKTVEERYVGGAGDVFEKLRGLL